MEEPAKIKRKKKQPPSEADMVARAAERDLRLAAKNGWVEDDLRKRARSCPLAKRLASAFVGAARRADLLSVDARPRRRVYALALPPLHAAAMGVRELDGAFYWRGVEEAAPAALRNAISREEPSLTWADMAAAHAATARNI